MKRWMTRLLLALTTTFAITALGVALAQTTHEVQMIIEEVEGEPFPEFYFEPSGLYVEPGDTVRFVAASPHHTVTAFHAQHGFPTRVPEGVGPFSSPVVPVGETFEYTFDQPGVYDMICVPHMLFGMVIRVVAGEASGPGAQPIEVGELTEEVRPAGSVLAAPALAPDAIVEAGSVSWHDIGDDHKVLPPFLQNVQMPEGE